MSACSLHLSFETLKIKLIKCWKGKNIYVELILLLGLSLEEMLSIKSTQIYLKNIQ